MIMTKWFKAHTRVPEKCTYSHGCKNPPVIFWQMHYNRKIIGMAFCEKCAIEVVAGMMRDIQGVNRGMAWCEKVEAMQRDRIAAGV